MESSPTLRHSAQLLHKQAPQQLSQVIQLKTSWYTNFCFAIICCDNKQQQLCNFPFKICPFFCLVATAINYIPRALKYCDDEAASHNKFQYTFGLMSVSNYQVDVVLFNVFAVQHHNNVVYALSLSKSIMCFESSYNAHKIVKCHTNTHK